MGISSRKSSAYGVVLCNFDGKEPQPTYLLLFDWSIGECGYVSDVGTKANLATARIRGSLGN